MYLCKMPIPLGRGAMSPKGVMVTIRGGGGVLLKNEFSYAMNKMVLTYVWTLCIWLSMQDLLFDWDEHNQPKCEARVPVDHIEAMLAGNPSIYPDTAHSSEET